MVACIFLIIGPKRNKLVVDNVDISINRMKSTFFCNLWSLTKLYIVDRPKSL